MDYLAPLLEGLGVALGLVVGVVVTVLVQHRQQRGKNAQQACNLRLELGLNIKKIVAWLEEIGKYRSAIHGDSLHYGYFDLSSAVFVTADAMFRSGLLYKELGYDDIEQLQDISRFFGVAGEQTLSNQLSRNRMLLEECRRTNKMGEWAARVKPQAGADLDYWENKFETHKQTLEKIVQALT